MTNFYVALGDLDAAGVARERGNLETLAQAKTNVMIDMSRVARIDAAGLGAIAHIMKRLIETGNDLKLTHVRAEPLAQLKRLGLGRMIEPPTA